ncbi:MAG: hypothetical protein JSV91_09685 [Phycisphaerales bacterium]|nr:MAG: hypothetical protein JSV91_09685 [Phycisphaerales bacterium]
MFDIVTVALVGWIFMVPLLFSVLTPRRAVLVAFLFAWLFLPQGAIGLPGLPDLTKITATSFGALLGVVLFDAGRFRKYRFNWVDLPILIWCVAPMASSLSNGYGPYDGASAVLSQIAIWGVPYLIGRLYFNTLESVRELAIAIFIGGLVYVPLCLWEVRMSPQLHRMVYGYHPSAFAMTLRFGGYRPMVFMQHGLMVGLWMTSATLVGAWLWTSGSLKRIYGMPMILPVGVLFATTVLCKSVGALVLLFAGLGLLFVGRHVKTPVLLLIAVLIAPGYMALRATGTWSGQGMVRIASRLDEERARSLAGRLENEDMLARRAARKQLFGWGSWGDWRVTDAETGKDITVSDGMWIITYGKTGLLGLVSLTTALLLPVLLLAKRVKFGQWSHRLAAAPAALAVLLILFSIDNLLNAMLNPIFMLGAGALSGFYIMAPKLMAVARSRSVLKSEDYVPTGASATTGP